MKHETNETNSRHDVCSVTWISSFFFLRILLACRSKDNKAGKTQSKQLGPRPTTFGATPFVSAVASAAEDEHFFVTTPEIWIVAKASKRRHPTHTLNCPLCLSGGAWHRPRRTDMLNGTEKVPRKQSRISISLLHHRIRAPTHPFHNTHAQARALAAVATSSGSTARARLR